MERYIQECITVVKNSLSRITAQTTEQIQECNAVVHKQRNTANFLVLRSMGEGLTTNFRVPTTGSDSLELVLATQLIVARLEF